ERIESVEEGRGADNDAGSDLPGRQRQPLNAGKDVLGRCRAGCEGLRGRLRYGHVPFPGLRARRLPPPYPPPPAGTVGGDQRARSAVQSRLVPQKYARQRASRAAYSLRQGKLIGNF